MTPPQVLLLAFGIGVIAGLRSLTAPAVVAWAAHRGWLNLHATSLSFMGSTAAVAIFTILAVVELVVDQLASTPARTKPPGLIARILLGGFAGAAIALAGGQSAAGTWSRLRARCLSSPDSNLCWLEPRAAPKRLAPALLLLINALRIQSANLRESSRTRSPHDCTYALPVDCDWLGARRHPSLQSIGGGGSADGACRAKPHRRNLRQ